jgi:hypothetical protein
MSDKETAKPKRKRKSSEPAEKTAEKKSARSRKTSEKNVDPKDFVIDGDGELKPAKKAKTPKKILVEATETHTSAGASDPASELSAVAGENLAEAIQIVSEAANNPATDIKPRKRTRVVKKPTVGGSSEIVIKKPAQKTGGKKTEQPEISFSKEEIEAPSPDVATKAAPTGLETAGEKQLSPVFRELADPRLPVLPPENRARLQIQSPNRIFLYWSVKHNPFEAIRRAFAGGAADSYRLIVKLVNLTDGTEELFPVESHGSWWFNVNSSTTYRAELGFFAEGRPFIRLMFSNTVETPRSAPSPNRDWSTDFSVSAAEFAEVLEASGYAQDAFEVAVAGDDPQASDSAARETFFQLVGHRDAETNSAELRSVLFALASGVLLESLRGQIDSNLYARLEMVMQENAQKLSAEVVLAALHENFAFEADAEEFAAPVFGASSINFPRKIRRPKFSPISSLH